MDSNYFMNQAILEAKKAYKAGEVPVGCVIVYNNKVIARGYNKRESKQTTLAHAELIAIEKACKKIGSWRLEDCDIYVTLEPCPMCAGAIIQARMRSLYFSASDPKSGACGGVFDLFSYQFNHKVYVNKGILEEKSKKILKDFFKDLRNNLV